MLWRQIQASLLTTIAEKESKASKALYRAFRISGVMGGVCFEPSGMTSAVCDCGFGMALDRLREKEKAGEVPSWATNWVKPQSPIRNHP